MSKYIIKDTEQVFMTYEYEVEAETKEKALNIYINSLAGTLDPIGRYISDDNEESVKIK